MKSLKIIEDLWLKNRSLCSSELDESISYLKKIIPFKVHRFDQSQSPHNGWAIPPKWDVERATIEFDGCVLWDGTKHPIAVSGLSSSFYGQLTREELRDHLHIIDSDYKNPNAFPFHYKFQYRPWKRDWGFSVPRTLYNSLVPGTYTVDIKTVESQGYLDVLEYTVHGECEERFVFVTSLNHQGMCNANLSGCGVGLELFQELESQDTKFSYTLLIVQPVIGSEYYLNSLSDSQKRKTLGALFVGMQGSDTPYALQYGAERGSIIELVTESVLRQSGCEYRCDTFRSVVGYDEIVWEAHAIPMPSLTRFPFPEYHTSDDDLSIISRERLKESVHLLGNIISKLENQRIVRKNFRGVPATSHPSYNLYVDTRGSDDPEAHALRRVMDYLPMAPQVISTVEIQDRCDVQPDTLLPYLEQWAQTGLIDLI